MLPPPDTTTAGMPHNREAEEAVIGSVLINPDAYFEASQILRNGSQEFYIHRLRFVWEAIESLEKKRQEIDYLTINAELERANRLEDVGGPAFVIDLINSTPTSLHVETYAKMVVDYRIRRDLLTAANKIATLAYDNGIDSLEASSRALSAMTDATANATPNGPKSAKDVYSRVYDKVDELSRQPAELLPGIKTGFVDLDRNILAGGFKKKKYVLVGARPGEGKTAFMLQCLYAAAVEQRKKVAIFSLEMDDEEIVSRLIAAEQEINTQIIETGKLRDDDWPKFTQAIETGSNAPFHIDDDPYLTPAILRAKTTRLKAQHGLDMVIVDYLGLMLPDRFGREDNKNNELTSISRSLKLLAGELHCPILVAHQLNRDVEKRADPVPQLSDLRDSGSLEQDADIVGFLYTDKDTQQKNITHFKIAKHRGGPLGTVDFLFRREYTRFYNLARREVEL